MAILDFFWVCSNLGVAWVYHCHTTFKAFSWPGSQCSPAGEASVTEALPAKNHSVAICGDAPLMYREILVSFRTISE